MRNASRFQLSSAVVFTILALLAVSVTAHGQKLSVSIPSLNLANNERIVGFEIHTQSGRIAQLPAAPIGWEISINNDPLWNTTTKGSIVVGAAALATDFFQNFLVVEPEKKASADMLFDLRGDVVVTSDFVSERRIKLSMKDFVLKEIQANKAQ